MVGGWSSARSLRPPLPPPPPPRCRSASYELVNCLIDLAMSKPKSPPPSDPWDALFSSAMRPRAAVAAPSLSGAAPRYGDDLLRGPSAAVGGYTILIQHSMTAKSQRRSALASTVAATGGDNHSRSAGGSASLASSMASKRLNPPARRAFRGSLFGACGPFLTRQAFEELCRRCNGAVVFVSTLGMGGVVDFEELGWLASTNGHQDDSESEEECGSQTDNQWDLGSRRNLIRSFCRNGAWVDLSSNPYGWEEDDSKDSGCDSPFVHKSTIEKLQSMATAIRRAASNVQARRPSCSEQGHKLEKQQMEQPIPIVFESLTPLLQVHGVEKVAVFLKSLGRAIASITKESSGIQPIMSPIIAPVLYESMSPSEHRCLEDMAGAMAHLNFTDAPPDSISTAFASGVLNLVRGGGGGGGGLGGKLLRHRVPFHMMRAATAGGRPGDGRNDCYWVLDHDQNASTKEAKKNQRKSDQSVVSAVAVSDSQPAATTATPSRPRIYLQDDDPEFDDFDEEDDLDDDIDL